MSAAYKLIVLAEQPYLDTIRKTLSDMEIVHASNRYEDAKAFTMQAADDAYIALIDDALLLDKTYISLLRNKQIPTVVVVDSVKDGFALLELGASDMVVRHANDYDSAKFLLKTLMLRVRETAEKATNLRHLVSVSDSNPVKQMIAIGSSTGGTESLLRILRQMPANTPPILVVQHMPPVFTKLYADRLNTQCSAHVWEARDGDAVTNGSILIAPGDYHMRLVRSDNGYRVTCKKGEKVLGQCPSVDVLFESVAEVAGSQAIGVILTGMGSDGAKGLLQMRRRGAYTIGQDEATSVVYGMPHAAFEMGAVIKQAPLDMIAQCILEQVRA